MSASIEFIIFSSLALAIVFLTLSYSYYYFSVTAEQSDIESIYEILNSIATEINVAVKIGDGYERYFYISSKNLNFTLKIENYLVSINFKGNVFSKQILIKEVNGTIRFNSLNKIKNVDGKIFIE